MYPHQNQSIGRLGEDHAADYLKKTQYQIVDRNFRTRAGEIDIICRFKEIIVFVEVKSRVGDSGEKPYESVTLRKLLHLKRAIYYYILEQKLTRSKLRLDVISILFGGDMKVRSLQHFENVELSQIL